MGLKFTHFLKDKNKGEGLEVKRGALIAGPLTRVSSQILSHLPIVKH